MKNKKMKGNVGIGKEKMTEKVMGCKQPPYPPYPPLSGLGRTLGAVLLPSWMYGDPADVAERIERTEIARVERERRRMHKDRLLGAGTMRLIKRMRIRELVGKVMKGQR